MAGAGGVPAWRAVGAVPQREGLRPATVHDARRKARGRPLRRARPRGLDGQWSYDYSSNPAITTTIHLPDEWRGRELQASYVTPELKDGASPVLLAS